MQPARTELVENGPSNGTAWRGALDVLIPLSLTAGETMLAAVPPVSPNVLSGTIIEGPPGPNNVLWNLSSVRMVWSVDVAASLATLAITLKLYRDGALIGGGGFAGFVAGASPAWDQWVPAQLPFLTANTALQIVPGQSAVSATKAILPLQIGDVITVVTTYPGSYTTVPAILLDIL